MDDLFFRVFVQFVVWRALYGFCACFVPVDLCYGWGVVIPLAVSFVDLFLLLLLFVSFRLFALLPFFFAFSFVCLLGEVGFVWPIGWPNLWCRCVVSFIFKTRHQLVYECCQQCYVFWLLERVCSGFGETSLLVYRWGFCLIRPDVFTALCYLLFFYLFSALGFQARYLI